MPMIGLLRWVPNAAGEPNEGAPPWAEMFPVQVVVQ